jgi:dynein heavy chain
VKRLFFPRFFFLSNDELLEILSETKDPTRVQPHLKKCFEGIAKLDFTEDQEILGMISAEGENVAFDTKLIPAQSNGMVEKWLNDVGIEMLEAVRSQTFQGLETYANQDRSTWVQDWPGMVVIAVSTVYWTKDVEDAIVNNTLTDYLVKSNLQIDGIVDLVRGKLAKSARTTLGALTVVDVHARDVVESLSKSDIKTTNDFNWIAQLRYYWEPNDYGRYAGKGSDLVVKMITSVVLYG